MKIAIAGGTGAVGRHVTAAVAELGHEPVVLARSTGVDLVSGAGLADALSGVTAVVDVASVQTRSADVSKTFFGGVTRQLHVAERAAGVTHHLALGIVGSTSAPFGYYAGKALQEELVEAGPVPWTILRATQFHEFAAQVSKQITVGPVILIPKMHSQPVAAREVGRALASLAVGPAQGRVRDLAGPEDLWMIDMVKSYAAAVGQRGRLIQISVPGGFGRALRDGTLLAAPDAHLGAQTYAEWIAARGWEG